MEKVKSKFFNLLVWASVLVSFIAFVVTGGIAWFKTENEDLKNTCKKALAVVLIFFVAEIFLTLFNQIGGIFDGYYASAAYEFYDIANSLVRIVKIITVAVFAILELVSVKTVYVERTVQPELTESQTVKPEQAE